MDLLRKQCKLQVPKQLQQTLGCVSISWFFNGVGEGLKQFEKILASYGFIVITKHYNTQVTLYQLQFSNPVT